jgi:hypothetical protein
VLVAALWLTATVDEPPARVLPGVTTVCRAAEGRCWTEPGEGRCTGGAVFRIVIGEPGRPDLGDALAACRRPPSAR